MSTTTVSQFATELKMPVTALLEQLARAGVSKEGGDDSLTDQDKNNLLEYLRRSHGEAEPKNKITLTRKSTSEIKAKDAHGRARTVQVEVRKKRVLVKRDTPEATAEPVTDEEALSLATTQPEMLPENCASRRRACGARRGDRGGGCAGCSGRCTDRSGKGCRGRSRDRVRTGSASGIGRQRSRRSRVSHGRSCCRA